LPMARFRWSVTVILGLVLGAAGCKAPPKPPDSVWEGEKIGELAPPPRDRPPPARFLGTATVDIHVLEFPADNIDKLQPVWEVLSAAPIRLSSYNAFSENTFRLLYGRVELWGKIPVPRPIAFIGNDLSKQTANVGSGVLTLRLWAQPGPWSPGVRKVVGCPTYAVPISTAIPQLQAQAQRKAFTFVSASWACLMRPGDLLVLGPEKYTSERDTLGGLFFNKPDETLFLNFNKHKPAERKPAIRLYILVCTTVSG
jgi:hypothetical protein